MNVKLRKRHRSMIAILTLVVPLGLTAGLLGRKSIPATRDFPAFFDAGTFQPHQSFVIKGDWSGAELDMQLVEATGDSVQKTMLRLVPAQHLRYPEMLLYWSDARANESDILPDNAFLIGRIANSGESYVDCPINSGQPEGKLLLYSMPQQKVIATAHISLHPVADEGRQ